MGRDRKMKGGKSPYPLPHTNQTQFQNPSSTSPQITNPKSQTMLQGLTLSAANPTTALPKLTFSSLPNSPFHGGFVALPGRARVAGSQLSRRAPVVAMSKKDDEMREIRDKTTEELNQEIVDLKGELFVLRLQKSARADFKSSEFVRMRRRIARMLTVKRERQLEEGINKRLSRKLDRQWKKSIVFRPPPSLKKLEVEEAAKEAESSS